MGVGDEKRLKCEVLAIPRVCGGGGERGENSCDVQWRMFAWGGGVNDGTARVIKSRAEFHFIRCICPKCDSRLGDYAGSKNSLLFFHFVSVYFIVFNPIRLLPIRHFKSFPFPPL